MSDVTLTSKSPISPNDNGICFFRAPGVMTLANVQVSPDHRILRVVAGDHTIEAVDGVAWKDLLAGKTVKEGTFVMVHVTNLRTEAAPVEATLSVVEEIVHAAEVVASGASNAAPGPARADARPFAMPPMANRPAPAAPVDTRPQFPGMRPPGRGNGGSGGGLMRNLGVVRHGKVNPEDLGKGTPPMRGMAPEDPARVLRGPQVPSPTRGDVTRGDVAPATLGGSSSVVRSPLMPRAARPGNGVRRGNNPLPIRPVTAGPAPVLNPGEITSPPDPLTSEAAPTALAVTEPSTLVDQTVQTEPDTTVVVHLMSGHAVAVHSMLMTRNPLRAAMKNAIVASVLRPTLASATTPPGMGSVAVRLTPEEHTALLHMARAGVPLHPLASAVRQAFERAIPAVPVARVG